MFVNCALNLKLAGEFFNRHAVNNKARKSFHLPLFERLSFYVLFHFPSGILFHLSLTVLTTLSVYKAIFSLTRWSSLIHTEFHVFHATREKEWNNAVSPERNTMKRNIQCSFMHKAQHLSSRFRELISIPAT